VRGVQKRLQQLSVAEDMQGSNSPRKGRAHIFLGKLSFRSQRTLPESLPAGLGDVSIVYRSFMVCMS
jgi:hypothetical protein